MELTDLQSYLPDFDKLRQKIQASKTNATAVNDFLKQYQPVDHAIMDKGLRPDKTITTDEAGTRLVPVTRLALPLQKKIVALAAAFLCGNPIKLSATPADQQQKDLLAVIQKTWDSNKLNYESKGLAKMMMSETEVAEVWYTEEADTVYWNNTPNAGKRFRLRMKILANSLGDSLYPVFNNSGDMIAFARGYTLKVDNKTEEHFDIYTEATTYKAVKNVASWDVITETNMIGKIPVMYYYQPKPEWADVQTLVERFELTLSNHSDTNDYFCSPMVKVNGEIEGFASKGESGKVIKLKDGATAEYMSWDQSPKSMELEFNNLRSLIYDMTDTPDISIETMKGLGTFSGIALKMLFLAPHLKAADKEETFGKTIQRRINFIKAAMATINISLEKATAMEISPKFEYFLPKNEGEMVDMLVSATGGGKAIMSTETAVSLNPLVNNAEQEMQRIEDEGAALPLELP